MAAGPQAEGSNQPSRRRGERYLVQAPLDVTVLRSGIPDTLPGRSVNLGERGIFAVLAGELLPGEVVGVEIQLPMADPLRTRALVRHHDKLRSGMEFVGLSLQQRAAIRQWAASRPSEPEIGEPPAPELETTRPEAKEYGGGEPAAGRRRGRRWILWVAFAAIMLAGLWWRWNKGWKDLESDLPKDVKIVKTQQPEAQVPADVMQKLIIHRVDPEYPVAARHDRLQGVIALDVVVGRDGSVVAIHALNGPEVLAKAAVDSLRWWRFEPYRVAGQPVVAETTVAVEFKP